MSTEVTSMYRNRREEQKVKIKALLFLIYVKELDVSYSYTCSKRAIGKEKSKISVELT